LFPVNSNAEAGKSPALTTSKNDKTSSPDSQALYRYAVSTSQLLSATVTILTINSGILLVLRLNQ
jgi:hypothetical protein